MWLLVALAGAASAQEAPSPGTRTESEQDRARRARLTRILEEDTDRARGARPPPQERIPEPTEAPVNGEPRGRESSGGEEPEARPAGRAPGSGGSGVVAAFMKLVLWTLFILVGAVLLAMAVQGAIAAWRERRGREEVKREAPAPSRVPAAGAAGPPVRRDPEAWLADARKWAAEGRFRDALRCLLFASMERLHRARLIDFERARTNREVLRRFLGTEEARGAFTQLVSAFDGAMYGGRPFGARQWEESESVARRLLAGVPDESGA